MYILTVAKMYTSLLFFFFYFYVRKLGFRKLERNLQKNNKNIGGETGI